MKNIKSICVFCGSSNGAQTLYKETAYALGAELAKNETRLVYGGGSVGLMGAVADGVLDHGGYVVGVMPQGLFPREIDHPRVQELHSVETMHQRKAMMAELADAFVALPGGFGTYEELFEVITWAQLGIHNKPILVLNTAGYYQPLLELVAHGKAQGFIRTHDHELVLSAEHIADVLPSLRSATTQAFRPKWLDSGEI